MPFHLYLCSSFFVLELSPFGTQIDDVSCDPELLHWAVLAEDLIGCVSHCCIEGVVSVNISMSMSESRMESAANFPPIFAWKISATSGSFSFSRSNLILVLHCFFALFRCKLKVILTSSWSLPMSAPGKLRVLAMFTFVLTTVPRKP